MGTRSLTVINDEDGKEICVLYRQYKGNPEAHGRELATFLNGIKIVNGINSTEINFIANGMNGLAAQIISHFKKNVGDFYLYTAGTRDMGEEYIYIVNGKVKEEPTITIIDPWEYTPKEFLDHFKY